jgi:hypothetical protein
MIFNTYLPYCQNFRTVQLVVSALDRSIPFLDHLSRAIIGDINSFVKSHFSREGRFYHQSRRQRARTLVTCRSTTQLSTVLPSPQNWILTRVDYEKSKRPDKG